MSSNDSLSKRSRAKPNRLRTAIVITVLLHLVAAGLALIYSPDLRRQLSGGANADPTGSASAAAPSPPPAAPDPTPKRKKEDPEWNQRVEDKVQDNVAKAAARDEDDNRTLLEKRADELNKLSTDESITQMETVLKDALHLESRATAPLANPPAGDFDAKSAQFHEVRRERKDSGGFRYLSVMVDAEGRSMEIELTEAEGESVYKTMKMVQENPLLDKVYRQFVIPAMDKASKASQHVEQAKTDSEKPKPSNELQGKQKAESSTIPTSP